MIISPKYKFVFLASTKTGSTTIHKTLLNYVKDKNLINESELFLGDKHLSCSDLIKQRPQYKNYFKFAFVRNPWDRVVSWYFFSKRSKKSERNTSDISFKKFLNTKLKVWAAPKQVQYEFTKCCEFVGRYENLQEDFNTICDKIGISTSTTPTQKFNKPQTLHRILR